MQSTFSIKESGILQPGITMPELGDKTAGGLLVQSTLDSSVLKASQN